MDPLTLLAAANAAVAAVKKGCQLYKDIKNAAGDVNDVLKDLKEQFHKIVDPTPAQKMQYNAEVQRVQEIAKADPNDVFTIEALAALTKKRWMPFLSPLQSRISAKLSISTTRHSVIYQDASVR